MKEFLTVEQSRQMLLFVAKKMILEEAKLNKADYLGDSDHGTGMKNGFQEVINKLENNALSDFITIFHTAGTAIMMSAGGASGIIFGELFRGGAHIFNSKTGLSASLLTQFLEQSAAAIMKRGGKRRGQKTMLDALIPVVEAAQKNSSQKSIAEFFYILSQAAEKGAKDTIEMIADAGRMQNLGERSKGQIDPGAVSIMLIFLYMYQFVKNL